ncbi:MAG: hypothetical protein DI565_11510 [Ancylobacter novellus]|uniref:Uncharacterized protein n=1 Tax=Ancylobacter novellus TaxID=921 RepID=A0A2W5KG79_ANCNO|nr:MAG: hypothetical protein DI565_11510 [Ancylobacter novellus]
MGRDEFDARKVREVAQQRVAHHRALAGEGGGERLAPHAAAGHEFADEHAQTRKSLQNHAVGFLRPNNVWRKPDKGIHRREVRRQPWTSFP